VVATRRRFSKEFKQEAVQMTSVAGVTITQIANELGIAPRLLGVWRKQLATSGTKAFPGRGKPRNVTRAGRLLVFAWASVVIALPVAAVAVSRPSVLNDNVVLGISALILCLPSAATCLVLWRELFRNHKRKLLYLLPLVFWPTWIAFGLLSAPFAYLGYLTYVHLRARGNTD
jgi:transposase-like protein